MRKLVAYLKGSYKSSQHTKTVLGENSTALSKTKLGGCAESHYLLMLLRWLEEDLILRGVAIEVNCLNDTKKKTDQFFDKELDSTMLPVLAEVDENGDVKRQFPLPEESYSLIDYLEGLVNPEHDPEYLKSLKYHDATFSEEFTPYSKLALWLNNPKNTERVYEKELEIVNNRLGLRAGVFLEGDKPKANDFRLMAKLYKSITVAEYVKEYVTPDKFTQLNKFMKMFPKAFSKMTCPMPDPDEYREFARNKILKQAKK